jgi:hypothetical protein
MKRDETLRHGFPSAAFAFAAPLLLTAFHLAMVSAGHAQPETRPEVPILLGHDPHLDACGASGVVAGLRHDGDGFLAVRGGPGTGYGKLDEITNGQTVFVCDQRGEWYAIVNSDDASDGCDVTSPWPAVAPYAGPCRSGWRIATGSRSRRAGRTEPKADLDSR